jgi:hypothetical protein
MAKSKHTNGKPNGANRVKAAERRAEEILARMFTRLYALENLGLLASKSAHEFNTLHESIKGLCEKGRAICADVAKELPGQHPARAHVLNATKSLDALREFMYMANHHPEADAARPARDFRSSVGRSIVSLTAECGRHIERAEQALGETVLTTGYLDGRLLDGGLDGGDMRQTTNDEYLLIRKIRGLEEKRQAAVGVMVAELEKQQEQQAGARNG